MTTTEPSPFTVAEGIVFAAKTRSKHPFALVTFVRSSPFGPFGARAVIGIKIVGFAASEGKAVQARARRLGAIIVPISGGQVEVLV
jgi:hypothetical protein